TYSYNNMRLGTPANKTCTQTTAGNVTITVATPYYSGPAAFTAASLVNVKACKDVPTSFARVIGVTSIHVCGNATARKIGTSSPPCSGAGCGTPTSDPDAPCTVDAFTSTGYYDHDSHLRNNPKNDASGLNYDNQGMNPVADNNHTGGSAGGVIAENDWAGATYWSSTPIDLTINRPPPTLTNTTTGSPVVSSTWNNSATTGGPIYIKPMTSIAGQS